MSENPSETISQPSIGLIWDAGEDAARDVRAFGDAVYIFPEVFQQVVKDLGQPAVQATVEIRPGSDTDSSPEESATKMLDDLLKADYARWIEFDEPTERALASDTDHRKLLIESKKHPLQLYKEGAMKTVYRVDPKAKEASADVLISRLQFFVGRVVLWSETQPKSAPQELPSAR